MVVTTNESQDRKFDQPQEDFEEDLFEERAVINPLYESIPLRIKENNNIMTSLVIMIKNKKLCDLWERCG